METLKALIREGEHQTQDFKFRIEDQKKIARTLVAFANTDGGRLLIGVKDNGKVTGINPEEEFHMIEGAASLYCKPALKFESKVWQEDFRLVLEVVISKSETLKYNAQDEDGKWKIYVRRDDHTLLANKILLKVWNYEKKGVKKPQEFGENELLLLRCFQDKEAYTLSQLYKRSGVDKHEVDSLLALFVYWEVIAMEMSEEKTLYRLA